MSDIQTVNYADVPCVGIPCVLAYDGCIYTCLHPVYRYTAAGCPPCVGAPLLHLPRVSVSPAAFTPAACRYTPAEYVPCVGIPQLHFPQLQIYPSCTCPMCRHTPAACLPRVLVVPRVLVHLCCLYLVCRFPQLHFPQLHISRVPANPSCMLPRVLVYPNCVPQNPCAVIPRLAVLYIPHMPPPARMPL